MTDSEKLKRVEDIVKQYYNQECPPNWGIDCLNGNNFCESKGCYFGEIRDILEMDYDTYCWCNTKVGKDNK